MGLDGELSESEEASQVVIGSSARDVSFTRVCLGDIIYVWEFTMA